MSNPTHRAEITYLCYGCNRKFKKIKDKHKTKKYHDESCLYFLDRNEINSYFLEQMINYIEEEYGVTPDFFGEPEFYKYLSIDGVDIKYLKAHAVAKAVKDGIAR